MRNDDKETLLQTSRSKETVMILEPAPRIKDTEYVNPDLREVSSLVDRLSGLQKEAFLTMLLKQEEVFQGRCGTWKGNPVDFELKPNARPFIMRPYPIPHSLYRTTIQEVNRLCKEVRLLMRRINLKYLLACFNYTKEGCNCSFHC